MSRTAEEVIQRIAIAFEKRTLPAGIPIFQAFSAEVDMRQLEQVAHHAKWIDIPHDLLCRNPLAPAFMTPPAFVWFLPAYLIVSITLYSETDTLTSTLITCLTPPDQADAGQFASLVDDMRRFDLDLREETPSSLGADDELLNLFMERVNVLTRAEKAAVRDYLEYIDAVHGADFPAFGPRQALDRYWSLAATPE